MVHKMFGEVSVELHCERGVGTVSRYCGLTKGLVFAWQKQRPDHTLVSIDNFHGR